MAYVHICEDVRESDHFLSIQNYREDLERRTSEEVKERLKAKTVMPHELYKHHFDRKRQILIIQVIAIDNETVFCLQKVMKHDAEYNFLNHDANRWRERNPISHAEKAVIRKMIAKKKKKEKQDSEAREIPDELREWLEPVRLYLESTIYESERWVSHPPSDFKARGDTFKEILYAIAETKGKKDKGKKADPDKCEKAAPNQNINFMPIPSTSSCLVSYRGCHVLYTPVWDTISTNKKATHRVVYFLYAAFIGETPPQEEKIKKVLDEYPPFSSIYEMTSFARRAYGDWVLYDDSGDLWRGIERISYRNETNDEKKQPDKPKSDPANLAMSAEEEIILKEESQNMPLFINGQAGSGKSTMLLYLFAEFCRRYIKKKQNGDKYKEDIFAPLFLTYNESLLDTAKNGINDILRYNAEYQVSDDIKDNLNPEIESLMWPFQKFVLDKLIPDKYRSDFDLRFHLTFTRFYQLYCGQDIPEHETASPCRLPEKKMYSPELIWHVVRTFIKGYSPTEELTPYKYATIPEEDRSIDESIYKGIYESVWQKWYKNLKHRIPRERQHHRLWDDQDLILCALKHSPMFKPESYEGHPVIFCDESQDFTQIELELLVRLSCFTRKYNLSEEVFLPFVFAGDQLQTVNPTGFSWKRLRANFCEKLNALGWPQKSLTNTELTKNFRSTPSIVKLANLIQFYRYKLLDSDQIKDLKPQDWWQTHEELAPIKFIFGDNISEEDLTSRAHDTIIIVPAELDGEYQFVAEDVLLTQLVGGPEVTRRALSENNEEKADARKNFKNIFTPAGIKGLEFNKIIIYKFGKASDQLLSTLIGKSNLRKDELLRASYFFNKLYVSLTRARESLFIIDSQKGDENLWKYFTENSPDDIYRDASETEKKIWLEEKVGYLKKGTSENITEVEERDPFSIAEELRAEGESHKKPGLMERAATYYRHLGKKEKALQCEALTNEYNEKWKKAGRCWMDLAKLKQDKEKMYKNEIEGASECFWRGLAWKELKELHQQYKGLCPYRLSVAEFMIDPSLHSLNEKILSPAYYK